MVDDFAVDDAVVDSWLSLLRKAQAGGDDSSQAWTELFGEVRPFMKGIIQWQLAQKGADGRFDASDIVQDCAVKVFRKAENLKADSDGQFRAWLAEIAKNGTIDALRRSRQQAAREVPLPQTPSGTIQWEAPTSSPSQQAIRQEEHDKRLAAIARLPADYQMVKQLRDEQMSFKEIAERMGRSVEAARKLYQRAIKRLEMLEEADP